MQRNVQPEILDVLPPTDVRAQHSRRDLARLNGWMRNARWIANCLPDGIPSSIAAQPPATIVEIGAGDGQFMVQLAELLAARWPQAHVWLVDQHPFDPPSLPGPLAKARWTFESQQADVFEWLASQRAPVADLMVANLFLHHFQPDRLRELLALIATRARCFIAAEPRRGFLPLAITRCLWLIGCHRVTRHDAQRSVHAGFIGDELTRAWPEGRWQIWEGERGCFSHLFAAW